MADENWIPEEEEIEDQLDEPIDDLDEDPKTLRKRNLRSRASLQKALQRARKLNAVTRDFSRKWPPLPPG
ncbi:MAG: hypothetical protein ACOC6S_03285 [Chloroflexota bacterium]